MNIIATVLPQSVTVVSQWCAVCMFAEVIESCEMQKAGLCDAASLSAVPCAIRLGVVGTGCLWWMCGGCVVDVWRVTLFNSCHPPTNDIKL